jgi:hypothetical protein
MGTKVLSNQRVTVLAGLASAISDWDAPPLSELAALTNISGAINWNSFDLNIQASAQNDDRTLTDGAGAQSRGVTNFGGTLECVMPRPADTASIFRVTYDILATPRVELVIAVRYGKLNSTAPAAGDKWTLYHVIVDAPSFGQGDVSKFYQVKLVARDDILPGYIVPPSTPATITVTAVASTGAVGDLIFASAAYQGWDITKSAEWLSSDETKLVMVHPGIFQALASGSPTLRATYPGATDSTPTAITIT